MKTRIYILILCLFSGIQAGKAQITIKGKVIDPSGIPMEYVNVKILQTNQFSITDQKGEFKFNLSKLNYTTLHLELSFIGFQKQQHVLNLAANSFDLGTLKMKELNLSLETIEINAKRNYEGSSNSSLIISRDIIERTPALSINDLLNQIPNRKFEAPSLQNVQNINLRSTFAPTTNNRGSFELNNAFGVALVLDGHNMSNNMNMQSYNPGIWGVGNSTISSGNSWGLNGSGTTSYSGDYAFGGTDLRQIPAENIESIEVITGVAPAKYGDLSEGAIIVERQAGKAPAYLRMQLRDNATSYGYTQGFQLGPKVGAVNFGLNYVNSFADNRDKIKAYKRLNLSSMYTNSFGAQKQFKNTFSVDFGRNLDGIKQDADDISRASVKFNSWNFSMANRTHFRIQSDFLKNVSFNIRYATGHQVSYREYYRNEPYIIVSDATSTGIHEGQYAAGIYTSQSLIDGRPTNFSAKLDFNGNFKIGQITQFLSFGINYDYGANKGLGQVLDPTRPRAVAAASPGSLTTNRSERYYDFSLAIPQENVGLYIEDVFKTKLFNRELNFRGGMRYDIQNAKGSFSPRLNVNYALNNKVRFGLAYGMAFKAPSLAQRYPGPVYNEIPLVNAYNGKVNESTYLVYVNRYDPDASQLKSAQTRTLEFTSQFKLKDYSLSLAIFDKMSKNGIGTFVERKFIDLPTYEVTPVSNSKPILTQNGTRNYTYFYNVFSNNLSSRSQGIEVIANSPNIAPIATRFNMTAGLFVTKYLTEGLRQETFTDAGTSSPDYAVIGIYEPRNYTSYLSNASISSATHIPKISFIINFIADFSLIQKSVQSASAGIPLGYLTRDGRYFELTNPSANHPDYGHLIKPTSELNENNVPRIIPNFHLSLSKEIKKRFRFSFNVYNVFNYQPYFISSTNTYTYPNGSPSFGAEISIKL
ncbi:MAG: hypothetical protein EOO99_10660 [Pedobacter sp.]|nr:MAG: hypothetical protein EOO99_10660 [Pedobacter sp.]